MKKVLAIGIVVLVVGLVGYRVITHGEEPTIRSIDQYQDELGIPVEVEPVRRADLSVVRHFTGTIEGQRQADAIANTTQKIVAIPVRVGDFVKKGQVVAELDVNIASNMSLRYAQSRANYEDARRDFERMQALFKAGAVSEQAFEKAKLRYEIARRDFEAARKLVKIETPISGVVTHIFYKVGETVKSGRPVVRIADLEQVLIEISIDESEIAGIHSGQKVQVSVAAYPDTTFEGVLEEVSLSADPVSRAFTAWVRVSNRRHLLRPGMFAKVQVSVATKQQVLIISKDAVFKKEDKSYVYVIDSENTAELREIQTGEASGNQVEVLSGLQENERVVVLGQNKLSPGKRVNIVG